MNILEKEKFVTVDKIIKLLDNSCNRRWVVMKSNRLCLQYPKHFNQVYDINPITRKKHIIGYKNLKKSDDNDHIFLR